MTNQIEYYTPRDWMTPAEAAAYWRVSISTIYAWAKEDRIPFIQYGGKGGAIRIPFTAFDPAFQFPKDDPRRGSKERRLPGKIPGWISPF